MYIEDAQQCYLKGKGSDCNSHKSVSVCMRHGWSACATVGLHAPRLVLPLLISQVGKMLT